MTKVKADILQRQHIAFYQTNLMKTDVVTKSFDITDQTFLHVNNQ